MPPTLHAGVILQPCRMPMAAQLTTDVVKCAAGLAAGQLVAFGTETVYGLGANALDVTAVARIFAAKQRPEFDPLIVHLADGSDAAYVADTAHPQFARLSENFWPGPLTILLPRRACISDLVTSGLPDVGLRVPDHDMARELIRRAGVPVAAPSANLFGKVSPTTVQHVQDQLGDRVDFILDGGPCRVGVESTVIQLAQSGPARILRPGGTTLEQLREVLGDVEIAPSLLDHQAPMAPGQLAQHYAPGTRLRVVREWSSLIAVSNAAALCFRSAPPEAERFSHVEVLSASGSLIEAAARFFAALRQLDAVGYDLIVAEEFPAEGLGIALNDRLRRAAAKDSL